ncbi:MAG TPA: protein phosphatase CheZ [Nitrospira sp.]
MIIRDQVKLGESHKEEDEPALSDTQLYDKLGELTRFIDKTIKTISQFADPMSATSEQLPAATTHLRDLRKLTEDSTHKVMELVETIESNRKQVNIQFDALVNGLASSGPDATAAKLAAIRKTLAKDSPALVDIITAMSFQDLVAQRVNKLVTIMDEVHHKLLELVVIFGPFTKGAGKSEASKASEMLKQLEASKTTSMNQDVADEILKQFGFN